MFCFVLEVSQYGPCDEIQERVLLVAAVLTCAFCLLPEVVKKHDYVEDQDEMPANADGTQDYELPDIEDQNKNMEKHRRSDLNAMKKKKGWQG